MAVDLICAGRAVLLVPRGERFALVGALIAGAKTADAFRANSRSKHPEFGDGTLAEAARMFGMAPEPTICDPDFSDALLNVLTVLNECNVTTHHLSK